MNYFQCSSSIFHSSPSIASSSTVSSASSVIVQNTSIRPPLPYDLFLLNASQQSTRLPSEPFSTSEKEDDGFIVLPTLPPLKIRKAQTSKVEEEIQRSSQYLSLFNQLQHISPELSDEHKLACLV